MQNPMHRKVRQFMARFQPPRESTLASMGCHEVRRALAFKARIRQCKEPTTVSLELPSQTTTPPESTRRATPRLRPRQITHCWRAIRETMVSGCWDTQPALPVRLTEYMDASILPAELPECSLAQ